MGLRRHIAVLRQWTWLIVAAAIMAGAAAYLVSGVLPKTYEGTATLIVGQSLSAADPDYNELLASQRLSQTYAHIVTTRPLLERVITELSLETTPDELAARVRAVTPRESTLVHIVASDTDPTRAAEIANVVAAELIAASPAIQGRESSVQGFIDEQLTVLQERIRSAEEDVAALAELAERTEAQEQQLQAAERALEASRATYATLLSFSSGSASNLLTIVEPAVAALDPAAPRVLLNTVLAMLLGLALAIAGVFLREQLDDTIRSPEVVEEVTGLPTLGAIPRFKGSARRSAIYQLITLLYPRSPIAEAYRTLRTNIQFAGVDEALRSLLVTSSIPGEGKTTTASNLAVVFAQAGRRTLILDADLRRPAVHRVFNLPNDRGLSTLFLHDERGLLASVMHETEQPRLSVVTSGPLPPNPAELLSSQRFTAILDHLREQFDLVIIDSPPLQAVTDGAILSSLSQGTLLVVDSRRTRRGAVAHGREALAKAGARVLGVALNALSHQAQTDGYYHYSGDQAYGHSQSGGPAEALEGGRAAPAQVGAGQPHQ